MTKLWLVISVLFIFAGMAFSEETNAGAASSETQTVVPVKKFEPKVTYSGLSRMHYNVAQAATNQQQEWGAFSFYYLTLKVAADVAENLSLETSVDLGTYAGQRNLTNSQMQVEKLIETAYFNFKINPAFVISGGRMWEHFAPLVLWAQTKDGIAISGSVANNLLKYGIQVFNDPLLNSPYSPLMEAMIGTSPWKGFSLTGV